MPSCPSRASSNTDEARFHDHYGSPRGLPAVEGERKIATILFADVVRSTALAEELDAEDRAAVMNGAFEFMSAAVSPFGARDEAERAARHVGEGLEYYQRAGMRPYEAKALDLLATIHERTGRQREAAAARARARVLGSGAGLPAADHAGA